MLKVPLTIDNLDNCIKTQEPFHLGVPLPKSHINQSSNTILVDTDNQRVITANFEPLANWPDGSIKWGMLSFCLDSAAKESTRLELQEANSSTPPQSSPIKVHDYSDHLEVNTGAACFNIDKHTFAPFTQVLVGKTNTLRQAAQLRLLSSGEQPLPAHITDIEIQDINLVSCNIAINGYFNSPDGDIKFIATLWFYANSATTKIDFTIWNAGAAKHPGGCWDLGDPSSFLFDELALILPLEKCKTTQLKTHKKATWQEINSENFTLLQSSSGGQNWQSPIHKDASNHVPISEHGYHFKVDGKLFDQGSRSSPLLDIRQNNTSMSIFVDNFWQNFPKGLKLSDGDLHLQLFPRVEKIDYELQPGERKTHTIHLDFSESREALNWARSKSTPIIPRQWYAQCDVFPSMTKNIINDSLRPIIHTSIDSKQSFFNKREIIDEYGWRNFGDLYADHENYYQKPGEQPFVSHYNNQYDAVYGFARQYIETGDTRWLELMDDLAKHVCDIDIYHTTHDKIEFNGGMFWHTDHYLDAHTCTHRTFSKYNSTSSTPGQTGGGPASEHCYSTGLMYHFFMTGYKPSKEAVLKLANWMIHIHDGGQGLLASINSTKNRELKKLINLAKGQEINPYHFPLSRGTGNYINVLLDAFLVSNDVMHIRRIETIIPNTLHPFDDINKRNLGDIEETWSYTILLQSLARFAQVKEELNSLDKHYYYACSAFCHYAEWMLAHEQTYFSRVDILEFPNHTWVAQEIRKLNIFSIAAQYSDKHMQQRFNERANEFREYITKTLENSPEKHYTRIQVILLQNYGPHLRCNNDKTETKPFMQKHNYEFGQPQKPSMLNLIKLIAKRLVKGLSQFSWQQEKHWLRKRLG